MTNERSTLMIEDMSGGIDRREGVVNRDTRKFYDLLNFVITLGKRIKRRFPAKQIVGSIDTTNTKGAAYLRGTIYTFAPRGTTVNHTCLDPHPVAGTTPRITGTGAYLKTLYFDQPPGATSWVFVDAIELNGVIVALLGHAIGAAGAEQTNIRYFVHVFDEIEAKRTRPTYLTDGAAPISFPQEPYGASVDPSAGYYAVLGGYTPVLSVDSGRIYISTWEGNVAYCAINRPRVWNTRTAEEIQQDGRWYYAFSATAGTPDDYSQIVPVNGLSDLQKFAEYGVEGVNAAGVWAPFTEVATVPAADGTFQVTDAAGAFPSASGVLVKIHSSTYSNLRFVARAKPAAVVVSGCQLQPNGSISAGVITFQGAAVPVPAIDPTLFATGAIVSTGAPVTAFYGFNPRTFAYVFARSRPQDGTVIVAEATFTVSTGTAQTGTVTVAGTTVTGVGTLFTSALTVGSYIRLSFHQGTRRVTAITDDLHLTVDSDFAERTGATPPASETYSKQSAPAFTLPGAYTTTIGSPVLTSTDAILDAQALLNTTVTAGGESRRVVAAGNGGITCDAAFTATATGLTVTYQPTWVPAYAVGDAGTAFYAAKEAEAIALSGDGDAGFINSSLYAPDGGAVVAMATAQNRLYVQYSTCLEMWGVSSTFVPTYLALQAVGAQGSAPHGVPVDDGVVLHTQFGPRMFYPDGNSKDYMKYLPLGDALAKIALPNFTTAVWWQAQSQYVAAGTAADIWALTYNRGSKIVGWARWNITGITSVSQLYVAGTQLLIRVEGVLHIVDPAAVSFRDSGDPAGKGNAYTSRARWLYADFGKPRNNKKLVRAEIVQDGEARVSFFVSAADATDVVDGPAAVEGNTQGHAKVGVLALGAAIAPQVESTDEAGYELDALGFDYVTLRR